MSILETEYNEKAYGKTRFDEGYDEGVHAGIEQGKQSEKIEMILRMIAKNAPIELIAEYTETSIQEIANLIEKNK